MSEHLTSETPSACDRCLRIGCRGGCCCPAPEPPSDEAAMHIDPEPPGVTTRPFTDAEVAALDAEPSHDHTMSCLQWMGSAHGRACVCLRGNPPLVGHPKPPSGGEVTADELAEMIRYNVWDPHDAGPEDIAAAILARYDVRGKP